MVRFSNLHVRKILVPVVVPYSSRWMRRRIRWIRCVEQYKRVISNALYNTISGINLNYLVAKQ